MREELAAVSSNHFVSVPNRAEENGGLVKNAHKRVVVSAGRHCKALAYGFTVTRFDDAVAFRRPSDSSEFISPVLKHGPRSLMRL